MDHVAARLEAVIFDLLRLAPLGTGRINSMAISRAMRAQIVCPFAIGIDRATPPKSRWLGEHGIGFEWQKGYGAFSVSPPNLDVVQNYIRNQPEHHKKSSFDDEFLTLLKKSGIPFVVSEALG